MLVSIEVQAATGAKSVSGRLDARYRVDKLEVYSGSYP